MTWREVAEEIGVSAATIKRTQHGGRMELDGALAMVRWLNRTIESFAGGVSREITQERRPI